MSFLLWYRDEGAVANRAYGVRLMSLLLWYRDEGPCSSRSPDREQMSLLLWYRAKAFEIWRSQTTVPYVPPTGIGPRMSLLLIAVGNRAYRGRFYVCPAKKKGEYDL